MLTPLCKSGPLVPLTPAVFHILLALFGKERHGYDIRLKRTSAAGAREGIFGPRSLMWRISREAAVSLAAGRALLLSNEAVHPVGPHASVWTLNTVGRRPPERERPELLFASLHDHECQPTWATRCWAAASAAVLDCVGSVRTVAFCPSQSRVSSTILPSGNSSAS